MIECRNPLMNTIGPVISGRRLFAVAVFSEDQSIPGTAMVADRNAEFVTTICGARQRDVELFTGAIELDGRARDRNRVNGHLTKIQIDLRDILLEHFQRDVRPRRSYFGELFVESEINVVVQGLP